LNFELCTLNYTYDYPRPCVTVDAVVFRKRDGNWETLLIQRKNYPYEGQWAFPGGFIDMAETLEEAVVRELEEETGLRGVKLQQLHAFSAVNRDPRHRTIGIAFYGFADELGSEVKGGDDAAEAQWFPVDDMPPLAFDHEEMFKRALEKIS
jgi:8-oxo-dGTP diphosphatase